MLLLYERNDYIIFAEDQDQKTLYNPSDGKFFTLNEVGDFIWNILIEKATINHLIDKVAEEFDAGIEILAHDIPKYLEQLLDRDLIVGIVYKD